MPTVLKSNKFAANSLGAASAFGLTMPFNLSTQAMAACYSLRRVRHAYLGPAAIVYQSATGASGTVAFDANDVVSGSSVVTITAVGTSGYTLGQQVTLTAFAAAADVRVTTWYDQSGNGRNMTTPTTPATRAPLLYVAGVLQAVNGKPILVYDGTDDHSLATFSMVQPASILWSGVTDTAGAFGQAVSGPTAGGAWTIATQDSGATKTFLNAGATLGDTTPDVGVQRVYGAKVNGASSALYRNRALVAAGNAGAAAAGGIYLGMSSNGLTFFDPKVWELLVYPNVTVDLDAAAEDAMRFYGVA